MNDDNIIRNIAEEPLQDFKKITKCFFENKKIYSECYFQTDGRTYIRIKNKAWNGFCFRWNFGNNRIEKGGGATFKFEIRPMDFSADMKQKLANSIDCLNFIMQGLGYSESLDKSSLSRETGYTIKIKDVPPFVKDKNNCYNETKLKDKLEKTYNQFVSSCDLIKFVSNVLGCNN